MWRETTKHERNRRIWDEELASFVPDKVLDFHTHVFPEHVTPQDKPFQCGGHPLTRYVLSELAQDLGEVFPDRKVSAVCFGLPYPDHDIDRNNTYLAEACDFRQFFPLKLLDPQKNSGDTLAEELKSGTYMGLKPYPDFARKENLGDVTIGDMLPDWALEAANQAGALIMLHIPRSQRLADETNLRDLERICTEFPNARVIVAHLGRSYYFKSIEGNLDRLVKYDNLYFDLAMVQNADVIEYAFARIPKGRLLFGTDAPISLAPGASVEINNQYTYVTPNPWPLSISDDHKRLVFSSFVYEELRAIKKAVRRLRLSDSFLEGLFCDNGMQLLRSVQACQS